MAESKARGLLRDLVATGRLGALPEGLSAPALAEAAADQGVAGLLLASIERDRPAWAEPIAEPLAARGRALLVRTLGQVGLAARCLSLLEARGLRALPLKGVALAETVYDVESDRPMSDVDLLALERWPEAVVALREAGFAEVARGDHAWALREPGGGEIVELHRSVVSAPGLFPPDPEGLWARSRAGRGQLGRLPSPEDLLLQLALHAAFQHGLVLSLVQWLDFRRVLEREPIDAERLLALAAAARAEVPLGVALLAAEAVVAAPVPAALRPRLPAGLRRWLAPRLAEPLVARRPVRARPRARPLGAARGPAGRARLAHARAARDAGRRRAARRARGVRARARSAPRSPPGAARRSSSRPTTSAHRPRRPRASRCPSARSCCGTASPPSPTCG